MKSQNPNSHFSKKLPTQLAQKVIECCREIEPKFPKVWVWVQGWANKNGHPLAIIASIEGYKKICLLDGVCVRNPWAYCTKIMQTKNGNFHERDYMKKVNEGRIDIKDVNSQIVDLINGMM